LPFRNVGVFGVPVASFGVTEEQARGSLHMHIVTWGSLPPRLLQQAAGIPDLVRVIATALDTMFSAVLDSNIHIQGLLRQIRGTRSPRASFFKCHNPLTEPVDFKRDVDRCIDMANVHRHSATCHKPPHGEHSCRLARPAELTSVTGCVQIEPVLSDNKSISYNVLPNIQPANPLTLRGRNMSALPIPNPDRRIVIWELYRPQILSLPTRTQSTVVDAMCTDDEQSIIDADNIPQLMNDEQPISVVSQPVVLNIPTDIQTMLEELSPIQHERVNNALIRRNGLVVEYNPVISGLLGCNTAAYILGSETQVIFSAHILLSYSTSSM